MIGLADPSRPLDRALLEAPGGFAWWYVDLVDDHGNGCVVIASFGLPFLPGREGLARRGRPQTPGDRPSLSVAVYREGRRALYLLQEVEPEDAEWVPQTERVRIGGASLHSTVEGASRRCVVELDVALPGSPERLTGTVEVFGPAVQMPDRVHGDPRHQWTPLCTATTGRADLRVGGRPFIGIHGRAYHDRNGSTEPLGALGIRHWLWGRAPCGQGERIWYLLWPDRGEPVAWGVEVDAAGVAMVREGLEVQRRGPRLGWFGLGWHRRLTLSHGGEPWLDIEHHRLVDDGFFYQRWLTRSRGPGGELGHGVAEAVRPGRVDRAWNRWLVRMAVHRVRGPNSPFLPLFAGVRGPRVRALPGEVTA